MPVQDTVFVDLLSFDSPTETEMLPAQSETLPASCVTAPPPQDALADLLGSGAAPALVPEARQVRKAEAQHNSRQDSLFGLDFTCASPPRPPELPWMADFDQKGFTDSAAQALSAASPAKDRSDHQVVADIPLSSVSDGEKLREAVMRGGSVKELTRLIQQSGPVGSTASAPQLMYPPFVVPVRSPTPVPNDRYAALNTGVDDLSQSWSMPAGPFDQLLSDFQNRNSLTFSNPGAHLH